MHGALVIVSAVQCTVHCYGRSRWWYLHTYCQRHSHHYCCSITTLAHIIPWPQEYPMSTWMVTCNHGNDWEMHAAQYTHMHSHKQSIVLVAYTLARKSQWCRCRTYTSILVPHLPFYRCLPLQDSDECLPTKVAWIPIKTICPQFPRFVIFSMGFPLFPIVFHCSVCKWKSFQFFPLFGL